MITDSKIDANRANAQHSTGPTTPAGKAISSRNATTHGLTAKTVLLPGEDAAEYQTLAAGMLEDFNPLNTTEAALAQELIDLQWRLRRVPAVEARFLAVEPPDMKALNNLGLYAARLKRQYSTTLKEYEQMHEANRKSRNTQLMKAETIQAADNILHRESTLPMYGFDFTAEYLNDWISRQEGYDEAEQVCKKHRHEMEYSYLRNRKKAA